METNLVHHASLSTNITLTTIVVIVYHLSAALSWICRMSYFCCFLYCIFYLRIEGITLKLSLFKTQIIFDLSVFYKEFKTHEIFNFIFLMMLISCELSYEKLITLLSSTSLLIHNDTFLNKNLTMCRRLSKATLWSNQMVFSVAWYAFPGSACRHFFQDFYSDKHTISSAYRLERLFLVLRRKGFCWKV